MANSVITVLLLMLVVMMFITLICLVMMIAGTVGLSDLFMSLITLTVTDLSQTVSSLTVGRRLEVSPGIKVTAT